MGEQTNLGLMTTYAFKGREYLVQMNILHGNTLDLSVTDKLTAELWNSNFDSTYIENQTHKTGNYKQFDIFISMLKSGLLKTSDCVTLDLLTFDDLESLRSRRTFTPRATVSSNHLAPNANRRYLIVTYTVEFDRIHYPLPLDYSGPPDPQILQAVIRRLEGEVTKLQKQVERTPINLPDNKHTQLLDKRINELTSENELLMNEIKELKGELRAANTSNNQTKLLREELKYIEDKVLEERSSFHKLVRNLRLQKHELKDRVNELERSERGLRRQLTESTYRRPTAIPPRHRAMSRDIGGERVRGVHSVTARQVQPSPDRVQRLNRMANMRHSDTRSPSPQLFHRWSSPTRLKDKVPKMNNKLEDSSMLETLNKPTLQVGCVGFYPPPQTLHCHRSSSDSSARSRKRSLPRVSHSSPTYRPANRNSQELRCTIGDHKRTSLDAIRLIQVRSRSNSPHVAHDFLLPTRSRSNSPLTTNPIAARQQLRRTSPLQPVDVTEQRRSRAPSPLIARNECDRVRSRTNSPLMRNNSRQKSRSPAMTLSECGDNNRGRSRTRREQRAKYPSTSTSRAANRPNARPCSAYSNSSWSSEATGPNSTGDRAAYAYPRTKKEYNTQEEPNHMLAMRSRIHKLQQSLQATKLPLY